MPNPYYNHQPNTPAAHTLGASATINSELDKITQAFDLVSQNTVSTVSPAFTGTPTAPTQTQGDTSTKLATDEFVMREVGVIDAQKADLESPVLTGLPQSPTAAPGTSTDQISTTQFATTAVNAMGATKASLASPAFTGNPTTPTPAPGSATQQIVNAEFVANAIAGVNAQTALTVSVVAGTSVALVAGSIYIYTNPAKTDGILPVNPGPGDELTIAQINGLKTNTYDTGVRTVTGGSGSASGVITMDDGKAVRLKFINNTVGWITL